MKHGKTKGTALLLAAALCVTAPPAWADAPQGAEKEIRIAVNGEEQQYAAAPLNAYGTVMVPFRELLETLGMKVSWNEGRKEVSAEGGGNSIILYIGSKAAYVNGRWAEMPQAPMMSDGSAYIPARFISESLGCGVSWDGAAGLVSIGGGAEEDGEALTEDGGILTYESAVETGLRKNYSVQMAAIGKKQAAARNEDLFLASNQYYSAAAWQGKNDLQTAEKWAGISLDISKEQTACTMRKLMDAVSIQLREKDSLESRAAYLKEKNRVTQAKYAQGMASRSDADSAKTEYDSALQDLKSLNERLEAARIELRTALDGGLGEEQDLEYEVSYAPVGEVNLERKYREALNEDPYIWYVEQGTASADYKLVTYEYNMGEKDYELTDLDLVSARTNEANVKRQLENSIRTRYNGLQQMESGLASIELGLEQARAGLFKAVKLHDSGMAVRADVLNAMQSIRDLEYKKEKTMLEHCQTKEIFEKLYLAPDYMGSGGSSGGSKSEE